MNKIIKIAHRDFIATVKTKTFLFALLITPILVGGILFLSTRLQKNTFSGPRPDKKVAIICPLVELSDELDVIFKNHNDNHSERKVLNKIYLTDNENTENPAETLKSEVRDGTLDACLIVEGDVLTGNGRVNLYTKNITDFEFFGTVRNLFTEAVFNCRYRQNNLSPELIAKLRRHVPMERIDLNAETGKKKNEIVMLMVPFFFLFLMFFGIVATNQGLLMSVIEEKNSRVIEILLSAVTPFQLMAGKILGQSAVGLTIVGIYGLTAYITAAARGMGYLLNAEIVIYFITYYILGFLLISSIFAAIGAACNTINEAKSLMTPLMMFFILPMVAWFYIAQKPDDIFPVVMSFIPPMTPIVMILRLAVRPDLPVWQIAGSIVLLVVSIPVVMWAASKVFRTGILMYGKQPGLKELLRWVRSN